jgi:thiol:disulfide interchange protein
MKKIYYFIASTLLFVCVVKAEINYSNAFVWNCQRNGGLLEVSVRVMPQHYLYYEQTQIEVKDAFGKSIPPYSLPVSIAHSDPFSGTVKIIPGDTSASWSYKLVGKAPYYVSIDFQGCRSRSEQRPAICFPPGNQEFKVNESAQILPVLSAKSRENTLRMTKSLEGILQRFTIERSAGGYMNAAEFITFLDKNSAPNQMLSGENIFLIILIVLLGGIGLNLTPCVLPMIPINLAIIGAGDSGEKNKVKGFLLGGSYGFGIAVSYGSIGLISVLTGTRFGVLNSTAWFNFTVAAIFFVLGVSLFGIFNIEFSKIFGKIHLNSNKGKLFGAFVMGAVAALLAGACVAPVVIAVIVFSTELYSSGQSYGLLLPFLLGFGMALPWPFAGAGMAVLPKPGKWMQRIKILFAVIIIAGSAWYAYQGILQVDWLVDDKNSYSQLATLEMELKKALQTNKKVVIDFWASWCKNCKEMDATTFENDAVLAKLESFVVIKFQAEKLDDPEIKPALDYFKIIGLPSYVILSPIKQK